MTAASVSASAADNRGSSSSHPSQENIRSFTVARGS
jgi:hypothetical protein